MNDYNTGEYTDAIECKIAEENNNIFLSMALVIISVIPFLAKIIENIIG